MVFRHAHSVNIHQSTLTNIEGDYYHNTHPHGERGIDKLFQASCPDASHDSQARRPPARCLQGTRVEILNEILEWVNSGDGRILWLTGPAGCGKSAIAQTISESCEDTSALGASFFFFQDSHDRSTVDHLVPSIVYQLVARIPDKHLRQRAQIGIAIEDDQSILHKPLPTQFDKLLCSIFTSEPNNDIPTEGLPLRAYEHLVIVVDGLDECQGDQNQRDIIEEIGKMAAIIPLPFRFLIVSRPEPQIEESFHSISSKYRHISLGDERRLSRDIEDIRTYLRDGFNKIYQTREIITEQFWPSNEDLETLAYKSGGAFIYASTVLKYINDEDFHPETRLEEILRTPAEVTPLKELDNLYRRILGARADTWALMNVLTFICLGEPSLKSSRSIELLLQTKVGEVMVILRRCRSIVDVSNPSHISCYHKSFRDFIHDERRAETYFIDIKKGNAYIACELLRFLRTPTRYSKCVAGVQELRDAAETHWNYFCLGTGCWHTHPELLEEISLTLDSYKPTKPDKLALHMLRWIGGSGKGPPSGDNDLPKIQYHLFKKFWESFIKDFRKNPVRKLTIFDRIQQDSGGVYSLFCWEPPTDFWSPNSTIEPGPLFRKLISEPENLDLYNMNVIRGDTEATKHCLIVLQSPLFCRSWVSATDYASLSWASSLLDVPRGNQEILAALRKFRRSALRPLLSGSEIECVRNWLLLGGSRPYGIWRKHGGEKHRNTPYGTVCSQEVRRSRHQSRRRRTRKDFPETVRALGKYGDSPINCVEGTST